MTAATSIPADIAETAVETAVETPVPQNDPIEIRSFAVGETTRDFSFLRINRPVDWKAATDFTMPIRLSMGVGLFVELQGRAISYAEWADIEHRNPMPDASVKEEDEPARRAVVRRNRQIAVLELSTGKPIPGKNVEEKSKWLGQLGTSEVEALYSRILDHCSGVDEGMDLMTYTAVSGSFANATVIKADTLEALLEVSQSGTTLRFQRPFESHICEIALKQFTEEAKQQIEAATKDPMPPGKPGKNPATGLPDPSAPLEYNWNDIRYLESLNNINRVRIVMRCEAILPFTIPGKDLGEKYQWVGARPLGDILKLTRYIDSELLDYRRRLSFI